MSSLGEMSAGMAHEINNPLAIIAGNIHLLRTPNFDPQKIPGKLEGIANATMRIEKIVKGLKKFSRFDQLPQRKRCDLKKIVDDALELAGPMAERYGIPFSAAIDEGMFIDCDPLEIEQVIINLVNNGVYAVRSAPERWVSLEGFIDESQAVLRISDSGNGIPTDVEAKLFQPFFTTKPVGEGTGLGLSIAKGILDQHGATIQINRGGPNTCFELRFPRVLSERAAS
jgi:signal transduction histidine kinase